ncbi:MAG: methionyl-tRNA formyltransferase [Cytophagales bacterium]|nr:methionyl-tRNA formyltransferase [Cytophagales bacterium]
MPAYLQAKLGGNWYLINKKQNFNEAYLNRLKPDKIFIPHWSYFIPNNIYRKFECIVFHMTDLPYGRGGSPLQNLIVQGHKKTKISALRVVEKIDAGDVYLKKELSLNGTAEEVFYRATDIVEEMIDDIITKNLIPHPQVGKPTYFKRRKQEESDMKDLENLNNVYDYIRMLDAEGYPKAFLETKHCRFDFSVAEKHSNYVTAHVRIIKK